MANRKVLLVEDEKAILDDFATRIRSEGYEVLTAENGAEALKIFQGTTILVVVTDLMMPIKGGFEVLKDIKKQRPATRVIITTSFGKDHAKQALNSQAFYYVEKGDSGTARELLFAIEKAFAEAEVQIRVEKEMLSFLTHTFRSSISGGPETVEQVLEYAQSAFGNRYQDRDVYRMINNIASLKTIFTSMASLLDAYEIFVNEPDTLRQKWQEDTLGTHSLSDLLSVVLRQTVASMLFDESNLEQINRILTAHRGDSITTIRETFLSDIFWSEEVSHDLGRVFGWIEKYLPLIALDIEDPGLKLDPVGVRYSFLFAILSEIIYNALKYTDCQKPIRIEWIRQDETYFFSCRNTFSQETTRRRGSQRGLAFIAGLTQMIEGMRVVRKSDSNVFAVELHLKANIFHGGDVI